LISLAEALSIVRSERWEGKPVRLPLREAIGATLANDLVAALESPRFDNSAMDGYAVGGQQGPWTLVGEVAAGDDVSSLDAHQAVRIFTGAPVPRGTFAVIPQETARVEGGMLDGSAEAGRHLRLRGEEFAVGQVLACAGSVLHPGLVGAVASQGMTSIEVLSEPRVAVLTTGNEVKRPGENLGDGGIYESNGAMLGAALTKLGCHVEHAHVDDQLSKTREAAGDLLDRTDALITVGGVSVGDHDYARAAAEAQGFEVRFSRVAIKPGKPVSFGVREDGKVWFGLPGNPMSALATFLIFVREWLGAPLIWRELPAKVAVKTGDRDELWPAVWEPDGVRPLATVGSHATSGWAGADGLVHVAAGSVVSAGESVRFAPFDWGLR
jgi:molybdopterin molybdotransferase